MRLLQILYAYSDSIEMGNTGLPGLGETFLIIHTASGQCFQPEKEQKNLFQSKITLKNQKVDDLSQLWMIQEIDNGKFQIVHAKSCLILDYNKGLFSNYLFLNYKKNKHSQSQQWKLQQFKPNSGSFIIRNYSKNKQFIAFNKNLHTEQFKRDSNLFEFQFKKISNIFFEKSCMIFSNHSGKSMDIQWACLHSGTHIIQWPRHNRLNQRWKLIRVGNVYAIQSLYSDMFIEIKDSSTECGAKIVQMPNTHKGNQLWYLQKQDDGTYLISSAIDSNLILCVKDRDLKNQAYIVTCKRYQPYYWNIEGHIPFQYV